MLMMMTMIMSLPDDTCNSLWLNMNITSITSRVIVNEEGWFMLTGNPTLPDVCHVKLI